ncbi:M14 family zinc carboxypeptidase [Winogradskyella sp. A2]|uniref:M14 family zinc carboxypeptidase n=1 Tax=Winogradskyella sp. A2 TaxID=3366944 RepID=UPI00398C751D
MNFNQLNEEYSSIKEPSLFGRYITNSNIEKCIEKLDKAKVAIIGYSVEKKPIYAFIYGSGSKKILLWSQMHGNESTTTKALFDCFNVFELDTDLSRTILESCTLYIIPILNPDGAEVYTRVNANDIDLNRDAQYLSQPESKVLRSVFDEFKPDYCFNLHGQRTIFGVGYSGKSASMSFLSPSQDKERTVTVNRKVAMSIISDLNKTMQEVIPNSVGRYDDGFNLNCVGDMFQSLGVPTILYEAGHIDGDYNREEIRKVVFIALLKGLSVISNGIIDSNSHEYFEIPENTKSFYDIIIRNAKTETNAKELVDIAIQYKEILINGSITFKPNIASISNLEKYYGHKEYDVQGKIVKSDQKIPLKVSCEIDFVLIKNEKISLKP